MRCIRTSAYVLNATGERFGWLACGSLLLRLGFLVFNLPLPELSFLFLPVLGRGEGRLIGCGWRCRLQFKRFGFARIIFSFREMRSAVGIDPFVDFGVACGGDKPEREAGGPCKWMEECVSHGWQYKVNCLYQLAITAQGI